MQSYALIFRDQDGAVVQRVEFASADDDEAQRVAQAKAKGRQAELWNGTLRIASWDDEAQTRRLDAIRLRLKDPLPVPKGAAVIATTPDGTVAYWDRNAAALYGWLPRNAVGRDIVELTPAVQSRETAADIMTHLRAGRGWCGEMVLRTKNGRPFRAFVLDIPAGKLDSCAGAIVGVSLPIDKADEILARRTELEDVIAARFAA